MASQEVSIKQNVSIILKSDTEMLDDVVVVAYGTAKKSSFTGSATAVSGEKIAKMQVSSVSKALEGAAAGVQEESPKLQEISEGFDIDFYVIIDGNKVKLQIGRAHV